MSSQEAFKKWKSCSFVLSAYQVHREDILTGLAGLTRRSASPEPASLEEVATPESSAAPDATFFFQPEVTNVEEAKEKIGWFLDGVVDTMERRAIAMVDADEANETELSEGKAKRDHRDEVVAELIRQYVRQRDTIANLHGEAKARDAGFDANVEHEPLRFHLQLRRAVSRFKSGKVQFEKSFGDIKIDPTAYGRDLESALETLDKIIKDIRMEVRLIQGTIDVKKKAIKAHDEVFGPGARCIEAAFRLAGMKDLADRVRPSVRRPGRLVDEVPGEGDNPDAVEPNFDALGVKMRPMPAAVAEVKADEAAEQAAPAEA